jgi:hypothetical protein
MIWFTKTTNYKKPHHAFWGLSHLLLKLRVQILSFEDFLDNFNGSIKCTFKPSRIKHMRMLDVTGMHQPRYIRIMWYKMWL